MTVTTGQVSRLNRAAPLTDAHVHPSLKAYLFRRNLWRHYWSGPKFDPFSSRSDFKMLERGEVGVIWLAHYLPERELFRRCWLARILGFLASPFERRLTTGSRFQRLIEMMTAMEVEINRKPDRVELARSPDEVKTIRAKGKIAAVHTIEGGHVLEGSIANLEELHRRGVAMVTVTHFYPYDDPDRPAHGISDSADGIPKDMFFRPLCPKLDAPAPKPPYLTDFGVEVVRRMKQLGMIVDVTHCAPEARESIYAELGSDMPIVASHVGAHDLNPDPYNLTRDEILHIGATGGVVGAIFMPYWLGEPEPDPAEPDYGVHTIWHTLEYIHGVTGSWDHVMLGTDFDGFSDPTDTVKDSSQMPMITRKLLRMGLSEDDVKKIIGGNAQRVLELGWR